MLRNSILKKYCHGNVKQHLRNACPKTKEDIRSMLNLSFARLRRGPDLILSFFHATGLFVRQLKGSYSDTKIVEYYKMSLTA